MILFETTEVKGIAIIQISVYFQRQTWVTRGCLAQFFSCFINSKLKLIACLWEITVILSDIKKASKIKMILNHVLAITGGYNSSSKRLVITCAAIENKK